MDHQPQTQRFLARQESVKAILDGLQHVSPTLQRGDGMKSHAVTVLAGLGRIAIQTEAT